MLLLAMVMLSSSINLARATTDAAGLDLTAASTVPASEGVDLHSEVHKAMEAKISGIRAKISGVREAHESMLAAVHPVIAP